MLLDLIQECDQELTECQFVGHSEREHPYLRFMFRLLMFFRDMRRAKSRTDIMLDVSRLLEPYLDSASFESSYDCAQVFCDYLSPRFKGESLKEIGDILEHWGTFRESKQAQRLMKAAMYLMSMPLCKQLGFSFDKIAFDQMTREALRTKYSLRGEDFYFTLLTTAHWICDKGYQSFLSGDISPLYMTEQESLDWFHTCTQICAREKLIATAEDHGFTPEEYFEDVRESIRQGKALLGLVRKNTFESNLILKKLQELQLLENRYKAQSSASRNREPPFTLLFNGPPGIGKSISMMESVKYYFKYIGKEFDQQRNVFTKNFSDKFWSNYNCNQHYCVVLDDIASEHPNILKSSRENSVLEVIPIVNTIGYVTNQADIADKGVVPFRSELVVATTNTMDLNAFYVASEPGAIRRRFPYIVTPSVKPEFRVEGSPMMKKLPNLVLDAWTYNVTKVNISLEGVGGGTRVFDEPILENASARDYFNWLRQVIDQHRLNNACLRQSWTSTMDLCECGVPVYACTNCVLPFQAQSYKEVGFLCGLLGFVGSLVYWFAPKSKGYRVMRHSTRMVSFVLTCLSYFFPVFSLTFFVAEYTVGVKELFRHRIKQYWRRQYLVPGLAVLAGLILCFRYTAPLFQAHGDKQDFWHVNKREAPDLSRGSQTTTLSQVDRSFRRSVIRLRISLLDHELGQWTSAFGLGGCDYVTTRHTFEGPGPWRVQTFEGPPDANPARSGEIILHKEDLITENDVCLVSLPCTLPKKDMKPFLVRGSFDVNHPAKLYRRSKAGEVTVHDINRVFLSETSYSSTDDIDGSRTMHTGIFARYRVQSAPGDCGSPLLVSVRGKPVVFGIHVAGSGNSGLATPINVDLIERLQAKQHDFVFVAEGDQKSMLNEANLSLQPLHDTSPLIHKSVVGKANVWGSHYGFRSLPRSRTGPTPVCSQVEALFKTRNKFAAPAMAGFLKDGVWYDPWVNAAREAVKPVVITSQDLKLAFRSYQSSVDSLVKPLSKLTLMESVNGIPGRRFINRVPGSTSVGAPFNKPKKYFLEMVDEEKCLYRPVDAILNMRSRILGAYRRKERAYPLFMAHLKDEARAISKVEMAATRVFTGCQYAFTLVVREYFLPLAELLMESPTTSELMIGTNPFSEEWGNFYEFLTRFGRRTMIAGDYSKFDKKMPSHLIRASLQILINLAEKSGYTKGDLDVMIGIATDLSFPVVDFHGDIVEFYGGNPSGHPLTTIVNSIANSLYMRMAFLNVGYDPATFRDNVSLLTYGDDNVAGVSAHCPNFNHSKIAEYFSTIGIKYTMADKRSKSKPYIHMSEVEILKRSFRWDSRVSRWLAPLNEESILKSLMCWTESKTISKNEQLAGIFESAKMEWLMHGKDVFDQRYSKLVQLLNPSIEEYMSPNFRLTWEEHMKQLMDVDVRDPTFSLMDMWSIIKTKCTGV